MKLKTPYYKYSRILLLVFILLLTACNQKEDDVVTATTPEQEVAGFLRIDTLIQGDYTFYLYKEYPGNFIVGYNQVFIQLKNNVSGKYITDANLSWKPLMHMTSVSHACPYSTIGRVVNTNTLYKGYFIFIMASDDMDYWEINYAYTNGTDTLAQVSNRPAVVNSTGKIRYKSFIGSDNASFYFLALVNPAQPQVGTNEITAYLYKKVDLLTFDPVENFTIKIDPRMPDMANHTSPNNVELTNSSGIYKGNLNLTMTGYWKINLSVLDNNHQIIKGEAVTQAHPASSLYFEIEF